MLRNVQILGNFADGSEGVSRFGRHGVPDPEDRPALIRAFKTWLGRKTRTRRGSIGTSWPVLGLRPTRPPFLRTPNVPKDEILTCSPRPKAATTSSRTRS